MVSEEAHYCIDRAARIMGMGSEGIIKIPTNEKRQIRTDLLEKYYRC
jgi:L-2,4-diaminobutyrate decarboxylase